MNTSKILKKLYFHVAKPWLLTYTNKCPDLSGLLPSIPSQRGMTVPFIKPKLHRLSVVQLRDAFSELHGSENVAVFDSKRDFRFFGDFPKGKPRRLTYTNNSPRGTVPEVFSDHKASLLRYHHPCTNARLDIQKLCQTPSH